ncbi:hypothetical protein GCM10011584_01710 [Nocardioides phosphati]|uniref:Integral membrane protein n=1 Tax=Nocardioides phosphati TaxID=1867775 RepID=A0ABQ2N4K9_9ACTN|nr:hypothetical protein [Nocardioides phosphati]GGO84358.1 hypothetical protein GCM10011584_01710 [Nocardioides phosphati]
MDFVRHLILVVHLCAFAALLGGLLGQAKATRKAIHTSTIWGARIVFLAGLALAGLVSADDSADVNNAKLGVKLLVALVVVGLLEARRRKGLSDALYWLVTGLVVANVCVAVLWR